MKKLLVLIPLLCAGCSGDDKVEQQLRLLDQIEKSVTLSFEDVGPVDTKADGHFERFHFKVLNGYTAPITLYRFVDSLTEFDKADNPRGFLYSIEGKDSYWGEISINYADPQHRVTVDIPPEQSVEFDGLLNKDAPIAKGKTEVRGVVTIYVDSTDINGRHIPSFPLPFPH